MPAHNIAHCNTPSGIAKRSCVYVPRIAADKCRAYAEFVRFIAKRDTCYGTRDTKAIAQRSRGAHPDVFSRDYSSRYSDRFSPPPLLPPPLPRIWENSSSSASLWSSISRQQHCLHDVIFLFYLCAIYVVIQINKSSRYTCINKHTQSLFSSRFHFSHIYVPPFNILYSLVYL